MNELNEVRKQLDEFINVDKFEVYGHLQPAVENSTEEDKRFINEEMSLCAKELMEYIEKENTQPEEITNIVKKSIERIEERISDTEDKEFCYELYFKIGEILDVDLEDYRQSIEEHMMDGLNRMLKKAGINLDDFRKNNPS